MPTGDCLLCHKPGHWARDCPLKTPTKPTVVAAFPPIILCPCNGGACSVLTSKTEKNPNRRFYKCSAVPSCEFFKWCDQVSIKSEPISVNPTCPCGSGPCRRVTVINGPNAKRSYFVCCIKEGFGACGFFQWEDDAQIASETEEADHSGSPCSTLIGLPDLNSDANLKSSSLGMVVSNEFTLPMNAETGGKESVCSRFNNLELVSNGVFASEDGRNQVYKDAVRFETEGHVLSSLAPKHIEPQVEALYNDLLGFGGQESYALEVTEATCVLSETSLSQGISNSVSNGTNKLEHQSITSGEIRDSFLGISSLMDLIEQYNSEKLHFESVSTKHVDALTAFTSSYKQLESFRDRAHNLRKQMFVVEKQVKLYEAKTSDFAASLQEVCGEMVKSQKKMVETATKVANEVRVYKQRDFAAP